VVSHVSLEIFVLPKMLLAMNVVNLVIMAMYQPKLHKIFKTTYRYSRLTTRPRHVWKGTMKYRLHKQSFQCMYSIHFNDCTNRC
jgi:hypothetical protein